MPPLVLMGLFCFSKAASIFKWQDLESGSVCRTRLVFGHLDSQNCCHFINLYKASLAYSVFQMVVERYD